MILESEHWRWGFGCLEMLGPSLPRLCFLLLWKTAHAPRPFGFRQGDDLGVKDIVKGCHVRPQLEFIHCSGWKTYWHIKNWSQDPWFNNMLLSLSRGVHQEIFPTDHWNQSAASTSAIVSIHIIFISKNMVLSLSLYMHVHIIYISHLIYVIYIMHIYHP